MNYILYTIRYKNIYTPNKTVFVTGMKPEKY